MAGYRAAQALSPTGKDIETASICHKSATAAGCREGHANRAAHRKGTARNSLDLGERQFCGDDGPEFGAPVRVRRSAMN